MPRKPKNKNESSSKKADIVIIYNIKKTKTEAKKLEEARKATGEFFILLSIREQYLIVFLRRRILGQFHQNVESHGSRS